MTEYDDRADTYLILIEGGPPSKFSAWAPELPGCVATGSTVEEGEQQMRAAIAMHLEALREEIRSRPRLGPGVYIERSVPTAA